MRHNPKNQKGLTLISYIVLLLVIGLIVMLTLKITPIYLDHNKVANSLKGMKEMPGLEKKSVYEIKKNLEKRFNMNFVYDITGEDIEIVKRGDYLRIDIEYEVVKPIVGNLNVLVIFHDFLEVGSE